MEKADRAYMSANALLALGDVDGAINRAHEVRQIADYTGGSVELDDARELVEQASKFVNFMRATFMQS
mgnify:FL=1